MLEEGVNKTLQKCASEKNENEKCASEKKISRRDFFQQGHNNIFNMQFDNFSIF